MKIFEQQQRAKQSSFWIFIGFSIAILCLSGIFGFGFSFFVNHDQDQLGNFLSTGIKLSGIIALFLSAVSVFRSHGLSDGHSIATRMGGTQLVGLSKDPLEKRLQNVVEEMAIASGLAVPAVYVLKSEDSINAFAAGTLKQNQVIAVTQGALENYSREELQAIVGHEFSHILHGDMNLNMTLAGYISGITIFHELGKHILNSRVRRASSGLIIGGFFLFTVGAIGVFFARLLQKMASRQREFLADASSAQFTRNPLALAKALARIKWMTGSKLHSPSSVQFSNFFIAEPDSNGLWGSLFSSHPPLEDRIFILDPHFNHEEFMGKAIYRAREKLNEDIKIRKVPNSSLEWAQQSLSHLPVSIEAAARDLNTAGAVLLGTILSKQSARIQQKIFEMIGEPTAQKISQETIRSIADSPAMTYTLMQLSLSTLKNLSLDDKKKLRQILRKICNMDGKIEYFEVLQLATAEIIMGIGPIIATEIKSMKVVQSSIQRILHLVKLKEISTVEQAENICDDLRALRRLAPVLKAEFIQTLSQGLKPNEDSLRLVGLCLAVPVPII